jgi:putative endonuclease
MARPKNKTYYFYILRCKDQTLYCGITNDLKKREQTHNSGKGSAYVRSRGGGKIVYSEKIRNLGLALKRESAVKKLPRTEKLRLIKNTRS